MEQQAAKRPFTSAILQIDTDQEIERITGFIRTTIGQQLRRRGAVVGISGGVDSSVVLALCARALGPGKVLGILLPERESSPDSERLALMLAGQLGCETVTEDISAALDGAGCYRRRDEAILRLVPEYGPGWRSKIGLPGSLLESDTLNVFYLTAVDPEGNEIQKRLAPREFLQIMASSNFKQRTRMAMLYYHAEQRGYAVVGTPNKNEHDLGFFVKHGDAGVDMNPIVHLYKSQVYQLAEALQVPEEIRQRTPTSDTYSAGSTQEEFFFRLPFDVLDTIWAGMEQGYSAGDVAVGLGLTPAQVERVMTDIEQKKRGTSYLRAAPLSLAAEYQRVDQVVGQ